MKFFINIKKKKTLKKGTIIYHLFIVLFSQQIINNLIDFGLLRFCPPDYIIVIILS